MANLNVYPGDINWETLEYTELTTDVWNPLRICGNANCAVNEPRLGAAVTESGVGLGGRLT